MTIALITIGVKGYGTPTELQSPQKTVMQTVDKYYDITLTRPYITKVETQGNIIVFIH